LIAVSNLNDETAAAPVAKTIGVWCVYFISEALMRVCGEKFDIAVLGGMQMVGTIAAEKRGTVDVAAMLMVCAVAFASDTIVCAIGGVGDITVDFAVMLQMLYAVAANPDANLVFGCI